MFMVNHLVGFGGYNAGVILPTTSYANSGGTGDRTGIITVTTTQTLDEGTINNLVDGGFGANGSDSASGNGEAIAGLYIRFDFGSPVYIDEAKWYDVLGTVNFGTRKWQVSSDASSWTDVGSSFTLTMSAAGTTDTNLSTNAGLYRYYQILGVSGNDVGGSYMTEVEFKIGA